MHFAFKAVAAANGAVSVELPGAAWSRRHSRDGFDSPSRSRFAGRSGFAHHDRKEAAIFKLRHYRHMRKLILTIRDKDHFSEQWFFAQKGKDLDHGVFQLTRKQ